MSSPRRTLDWDEGAASERTALAWDRTAIASVAVAVLVLRAGIVEGLLGLAIPIAAVLVIAGAAEWLFSRRIYVEHDRPYAKGAVLHGRAVLALAAVTLIAAVASVVFALAR
jgi:putative membrane protein